MTASESRLLYFLLLTRIARYSIQKKDDGSVLISGVWEMKTLI